MIQHKLVCTDLYDNGNALWRCAVCSYSVLVQWQPLAYRVECTGDQVEHVGSFSDNGSLRVMFVLAPQCPEPTVLDQVRVVLAELEMPGLHWDEMA